MLRPSREDILLDAARLYATRATCARARVGVVFARESRILVTGYNGAPRGMLHCNHKCTCLVEASIKRVDVPWAASGAPIVDEQHFNHCPVVNPCKTAVHAEANAISYAAREGISLDQSIVYSTLAPCLPCSQLLINVGVIRCVYAEGYRDMTGIDLLTSAGVVVFLKT